MIGRGAIVVLVMLAGFASMFDVAIAQDGERVRRLAILCNNRCSGGNFDLLFERLERLGWRRGQNLVVDSRAPGGEFDRMPALAAELVRLKPDVIFAAAPGAVLPAVQASGGIPVVFQGLSDPVSLGLAKTLTRPGGNVTGFTHTPTSESFGKLLELLKEAVPRTRRVALLWDLPGERPTWWTTFEAAAVGLQIELTAPISTRRLEDFTAAVQRARNLKADAVLVAQGGSTYSHGRELSARLLGARLPSIGLARALPEAGGLMSYGPDFGVIYQRAADYIDRILRGTKPGELPIEQPSHFELVVNEQTARTLGLTIPPSMLVRASLISGTSQR